MKIDLFNNSPEIVVVSGTPYLEYSDDKYVEGGKKTHDFLCFLLKDIAAKGDADWVIIDGLERVKEIAEMVMRAKHKLGPFENFANLNFWKTRKLAIREIQHLALKAAKKGLVYTTYAEDDDIIIEAGQVVKRAQRPKWFDIVEESTDIMVRVWVEAKKGGLEFMGQIASSKFDDWPTGVIMNLTGRPLAQAVHEAIGQKVRLTDAKKAVEELFA